MKELTLKELEDIIKEAGLPEYPKDLGNGFWKLSENCVTDQRGYEKFMELTTKPTLAISDNFEWDADGWLKYSDSFGTIEIVPKKR